MVESYIYIYHINKQFFLPVVPDSFTNSLPINFSSTPIPMSSAPLQTFSSAGPRSLAVTLKLNRALFEMDNADEWQWDKTTRENHFKERSEKMEQLINALSALSLPTYSNSTKLVVPPSILYRAGEEVCISGIVSGNVTISTSGVWVHGKLSNVDISFTITEVLPFSAEYTAKNGMYRSISTDLIFGS